MEFHPQLFLIFTQKTVHSHLKYWRFIKKLYVTLLFFLPILLPNLLIWAQVVMHSSSNIAHEASHMGLFFLEGPREYSRTQQRQQQSIVHGESG